MRLDEVRRQVLAPDEVWEAARQIASVAGCSVNDLLIRACERAIEDELYAQSLRLMYRKMSLPLAQWPDDPIDALVIAWLMADRRRMTGGAGIEQCLRSSPLERRRSQNNFG
jgi:hypothetical protein